MRKREGEKEIGGKEGRTRPRAFQKSVSPQKLDVAGDIVAKEVECDPFGNDHLCDRQ